jgi:hypothetical protein
MKRTPPTSHLRRAFPLLWVMFALQSLTNCSGKTDSGSIGVGGSGTTGSGGRAGATQSGGDAAMSAGYAGYAPHTAGCLQPGAPRVCGGPCGGFCGGNGGSSSGDGNGGNAGSSGSGGFSGYNGFAGHTAGCIGKCGDGCPPCPPNGGASSGVGGQGDAGVDAGGQSDGGAPAAQKSAPRRSAQACYELTGYEPDPCLPADDSLLSWLAPLPSGCKPTVTAGPEPVMRPDGPACCYSVACAESAE